MATKKQTEPQIDLTELAEMNDSELVEVARLVGYPAASRMIPRDDLISLILGEIDEVADPIAGVRQRMYAFVQGNKTMITGKFDCDFYCPGCPHPKVVECYSDNHDLADDVENK